MSRRIWAAVGLSHLADIYSTAVALSLGGHEGSPTAAAALGGGLMGLVLLKIVGLTAIVSVWVLGRRRWPGVAWVVPATATLGGAIPALWNTSQIVLYGGVI
jgi:hypothetical protein